MKHFVKLGGALVLCTALTACSQQGEEEAAQAPVCDRACLIDLTNSYVAGLESNDASGVTFSDEIRIVENLNRINAGEGLWADITSAGTDFSVVIPDEENQTAGWIGMVEREGTPAIVALRLKLDPRGSIVEAEHLYASVSEENAANLVTPRPGLLAELAEDGRHSHETLIAIGETYYVALDDNDGSLAPFAPDCERYENGLHAAGEGSGPGFDPERPVANGCEAQMSAGMFKYITAIDNRRVFAADPVTGLVMGLSHFRHPMDFEPYEVLLEDGTTEMFSTGDPMTFDPFDLPAAHVMKVGEDGMMHEVEAMGFLAPLNAPTGWED